MQEQFVQLRGAWGNLPRRGQVLIALTALVAVVTMVLIFRAATHTEWTTVSEGLSSAKAGEAETTLTDEGIAYRVENGAVQVAAGDANRASAALMTQGIAATGGRKNCLEIATEGSSLVASTSAQAEAKAQGCLENELANRMEMIDGVKQADVKVTLAGEQLFASEATPAQASVLLVTEGTALAEAAIAGIQGSVAASVEGLQAENVQVQDESGRSLTADMADGAAMSVREAKLQAESQYNAGIETRLRREFEAMAGEGNVRVLSRAELDMDLITRELREVGGEDNVVGPPKIVSDDDEILNGVAEMGVEGVAGSTNNIGVDPDDRTVAIDEEGVEVADNGYVADKTYVEYDNDVIAEAIEVAPGTVLSDRLSVVVDDSVAVATAEAIENSARAYIGGDAEDSFHFAQVPIATAADEVAASGLQGAAPAIMDGIKWFVLIGGLIGMVYALRRTLTQRTADLFNPPDELLMLEPGVEPVPLAELEAALARASLPDSGSRRKELTEQVDRIVAHKPADVANELRRWLHAEEQGFGGSGRGRAA